MPKVRRINPSDPGIQALAKKFTKENPGVSLLDVLGSLHENTTIPLDLEEESLICGKSKSPLSDERETTSVIELTIAVAYAQERFQRKNNEWKELNNLLKENFPRRERENYIRAVITDISDSLCKVDARADINFFNYLIEQLTFLSEEKEEALDNKDNATSINFDINPDDLDSGDNGFILNGLQAEEITNLFVEAADTPLKINDKLI